ncbi:hypothetical protein Gohar_003810 [Gossypium harknessii]|uniref:RNase H type-1 domain-containing protein n=1 Tax=Gossypium harknessii TaxID=34285 RepID=A0A7J9ICW3_9ROSI|nr:hypothetical protein [Gossypium harknessii]
MDLNARLWREELINSTFDVVDRAEDVASRIYSYIQEMEALTQNILPRRVELERWRPSESSVVNINFDAAFQNHFKKSCTGLVVRDVTGRIVGIIFKLFLAKFFVFEGKFEPLEGDCGFFVFPRLLRTSTYHIVGVHGSSPCVLLGDAVRTMYRPSEGGFESCSLQYMQRKANEVAHTLATKRIRRREETYLSNGVPVFAMIAVVEDRRWTNSPD